MKGDAPGAPPPPPPGGRTLGQQLARPFAAYARYTKAAFGAERVRAGAADIKLLWNALRERPEPERAAPPGAIPLDLATRAVRAGLWQTAWAARVYAATGALVWWAWVAEAAFTGRWASPFTALLVLLVVLALGLKSFAEALRNWQLRTGRMGSAAEFLAWRDGPVWPPLPRRPR